MRLCWLFLCHHVTLHLLFLVGLRACVVAEPWEAFSLSSLCWYATFKHVLSDVDRLSLWAPFLLLTSCSHRTAQTCPCEAFQYRALARNPDFKENSDNDAYADDQFILHNDACPPSKARRTRKYTCFLLISGTQIEDNRNFLLYVEVKSQDEIIHPSKWISLKTNYRH